MALLADCSAYTIAIVQDLRDSEAAEVSSTTEQPRDQNDDQNNAEYSADDITTTAAVVDTAIISEATAQVGARSFGVRGSVRAEEFVSSGSAQMSTKQPKTFHARL